MNINKNIAISGNGFVFDPTTGESFSLNSIGTEIISYLKQDMSKEEIVLAILEKYEIDNITVEKNYVEFLAILREYKLIEND